MHLFASADKKPYCSSGEILNPSFEPSTSICKQSLENGEVFDTSKGKQPLTFEVGAGQLIQGFDKTVVGMSIGESKTVTIPPEEAYGDINDDLFVSTVWLSIF